MQSFPGYDNGQSSLLGMPSDSAELPRYFVHPDLAILDDSGFGTYSEIDSAFDSAHFATAGSGQSSGSVVGSSSQPLRSSSHQSSLLPNFHNLDPPWSPFTAGTSELIATSVPRGRQHANLRLSISAGESSRSHVSDPRSTLDSGYGTISRKHHHENQPLTPTRSVTTDYLDHSAPPLYHSPAAMRSSTPTSDPQRLPSTQGLDSRLMATEATAPEDVVSAPLTCPEANCIFVGKTQSDWKSVFWSISYSLSSH